MKHLLSSKTLTSLYYSLIHSHIIYGIQVWTSCNQGLINEIFKLKKAIRIVLSAPITVKPEAYSKKVNYFLSLILYIFF